MLFFTQKTAYEMRISDWSSDVCSSDLLVAHRLKFADEQAEGGAMLGDRAVAVDDDHLPALAQCGAQPPQEGVRLADLVIHMDHEDEVEARRRQARRDDRTEFQ